MVDVLVGRRRTLEPGADPVSVLREEGDYCGPITGYSGDKPAVFFLPPGAGPHRVHHVVSPPHVFRECSDGSLEIRDSILSHPGHNWPGWHGYLDEGHRWRTC